MKLMTSAYANKLLKGLEDDKNYWVSQEADSSTYTAAVGEEAVIPEYDYKTVAATISEIDAKMLVLKHAININNANAKIQVGDKEMSVDMILVRMAQLNLRKNILDTMRKRLPKTRANSYSYSNKNVAPEYVYINYDINEVKADFEAVSDEIMQLQIALDKYNQTVEFEVEI